MLYHPKDGSVQAQLDLDEIEIDETAEPAVSPTVVKIEKPAPRTIRGSHIARHHHALHDAVKVELILDILAGRVVITDWTVPQLALLFGISVGPIYKARKGTKAHHPGRPADVLTRTWEAADPSERLDFAMRVGTASLWDTMTAAIDAAE